MIAATERSNSATIKEWVTQSRSHPLPPTPRAADGPLALKAGAKERCGRGGGRGCFQRGSHTRQGGRDFLEDNDLRKGPLPLNHYNQPLHKDIATLLEQQDSKRKRDTTTRIRQN